ncbi:MAG: transposase [Microthrixaceae bacterium]
MIAGATNIDSMDRLRSGSTRKVLGFEPLAPWTIGTFLRSFAFGHVRQLDAVNSRLLANAWADSAGPKQVEDLVVDLDSTVTEVYGKHKHGASYGYTGVLGYHPLTATRAGTGEVLSALRRAGVSGPVTVRADSGFWSWKLIDRLTRAGVGWSITVRLVTKVNDTIAAIPEEDWVTIDYTRAGHAQVAETIYAIGTGKRARTGRLVVRHHPTRRQRPNCDVAHLAPPRVHLQQHPHRRGGRPVPPKPRCR